MEKRIQGPPTSLFSRTKKRGILSKHTPYPIGLYPAGVYPGHWIFPDDFDGELKTAMWPKTLTGTRLLYPYLPNMTPDYRNRRDYSQGMNEDSSMNGWASGMGAQDEFSLSDEYAFSANAMPDGSLNSGTMHQQGSSNDNHSGRRQNMVFDKNLISPFSEHSHGHSAEWHRKTGREHGHLPGKDSNGAPQSSSISLTTWNNTVGEQSEWLGNSTEWVPLPSPITPPDGYDYFQRNDGALNQEISQQYVRPDQIFRPTPFETSLSNSDASFSCPNQDENVKEDILAPISNYSVNLNPFDDAGQMQLVEPPFSDPVESWVGTLSPETNQKCCLNIVLAYPKIIQRSYDNERRFLCPPPIVYLYGSKTEDQDMRNLNGILQPISTSKISKSAGMGSDFQAAPVIKSMDVSLFNRSKGSATDIISSVSIYTFDKFYSRDKDLKHCAFEFKVIYSKKFQNVPDTLVGMIETKQILVVSKPSKKPTTKGSSPHFVSGSFVSIHNRINSQNSTTRFLSFSDEFEDGQTQDCK